MNIQFTQITDYLQYPPMLRAKLIEIHSDIVNWVLNNFDGTFIQRRQIVDVMNSASYYYLSGDSLPDNWDSHYPLNNPLHVDDSDCRNVLNELYISEKNVNWDIEVKEGKGNSRAEAEVRPDNAKINKSANKEHLYIQPPKIPVFDKTKIWMSVAADNGEDLVIYKSLPEIPTVQNEISATTDVNKMTESALLNLFPPAFVPTRAPAMYSSDIQGIHHPDLGLILKIEGYSDEELIDNVVKYPHIYKLQKEVDGEVVNFYTTIEIDSVLYKVLDIWYQLPESEYIPYEPDMVKEYVTRRYLLERDIKGIEHKYPMYGTLGPFLTLFAPKQFYKDLGYTDSLELARCCVNSRVSYKQSRNPVIRRLSNNA